MTLAVANVERLETAQFIVVNVYDVDCLTDQVIRQFENHEQAVNLLRELEASHVWTSDRELYGLLLQTVGIGVEFKHKSDTACTRRAIEQHADILTDLFKIEPAESLPELPRWRRWLCDKLTRLIEKIGGGMYDGEK